MTTIVLADDHPFIRAGLQNVLELAGYNVVAAVEDGAAALEALIHHKPDIVILDVRMPKQGGLDVLSAMRRRGDRAAAVLLTASLSDDELLEALRLDVRGILFKNGAEDLLIECLMAVMAGRNFIDAALLSHAHALSTRQQTTDPLQILAPREREIALQVGKGLRNREIGVALGITEGTVKVTLNSIYSKLHIQNRTTLALLVLNRAAGTNGGTIHG